MNRDSVRNYNRLHSGVSAVYHDAAARMGISDSVQSILYVVYDADGRCLQSDIYHQTGASRQTINSAIRKLEYGGVIQLEQGEGRNTIVRLTDAGRAFAEDKIRPLIQAEDEAFSSWTDEEIRTYLDLTARFRDALRQKVEQLYG